VDILELPTYPRPKAVYRQRKAAAGQDCLDSGRLPNPTHSSNPQGASPTGQQRRGRAYCILPSPRHLHVSKTEAPPPARSRSSQPSTPPQVSRTYRKHGGPNPTRPNPTRDADGASVLPGHQSIVPCRPPAPPARRVPKRAPHPHALHIALRMPDTFPPRVRHSRDPWRFRVPLISLTAGHPKIVGART
jgi:hypothetical protein